jgi:hypothetical protein
MTQVTPIGATINHIKTKQCGAGSEVVFVENTAELHVEQYGAFVKTSSAPRIKRSSLELIKRIESRWALILMERVEVCRDCTDRPGIWIGAIK